MHVPIRGEELDAQLTPFTFRDWQEQESLKLTLEHLTNERERRG
jgi:hypothetical protein